MLKYIDLNNNKRLNMQIIFRRIFKYKKNIVYINTTTQFMYKIRSNQLKKTYKTFGYSRSFSSGNVKLKAKTYESIKDLTSNLQAESSADAARN